MALGTTKPVTKMSTGDLPLEGGGLKATGA
jgi:hypothetical protein